MDVSSSSSDLEYGDIHAVQEWSSILRLSTRWGFSAIRKLAISRLGKIGDPVDKIVEGRACGVDEWLIDSFAELCKRDKLLTTEEGKRLGVEDVLVVAQVRESMKSPSSPSPPDLQDDFSHRVFTATQWSLVLNKKKKGSMRLMGQDSLPETVPIVEGEPTPSAGVAARVNEDDAQATAKEDEPSERKKPTVIPPTNVSVNPCIRPSPFERLKAKNSMNVKIDTNGW